MTLQNPEPVYKSPLDKAIAHLIGKGIIKGAKDVAEALVYDKSTVSGYRNGKPMSPEFKQKFESHYSIKLEDLPTHAEYINHNPIKNPGSEPGLMERLRDKEEIIQLLKERDQLQKTVSDFSGKISALTSEVEELKDVIHGFAKFFDPDEASGAGLDWTKKGRKTGRSGHNA